MIKGFKLITGELIVATIVDHHLEEEAPSAMLVVAPFTPVHQQDSEDIVLMPWVAPEIWLERHSIMATVEEENLPEELVDAYQEAAAKYFPSGAERAGSTTN